MPPGWTLLGECRGNACADGGAVLRGVLKVKTFTVIVYNVRVGTILRGQNIYGLVRTGCRSSAYM
jgi:hypothetical protein